MQFRSLGIKGDQRRTVEHRISLMTEQTDNTHIKQTCIKRVKENNSTCFHTYTERGSALA